MIYPKYEVFIKICLVGFYFTAKSTAEKTYPQLNSQNSSLKKKMQIKVLYGKCPLHLQLALTHFSLNSLALIWSMPLLCST